MKIEPFDGGHRLILSVEELQRISNAFESQLRHQEGDEDAKDMLTKIADYLKEQYKRL